MKVHVTGYEGELHISFIKLLQEAMGEGFGAAKYSLDRLDAGHVIRLTFTTREAGEEFLRAAADLGAIASEAPA